MNSKSTRAPESHSHHANSEITRALKHSSHYMNSRPIKGKVPRSHCMDSRDAKVDLILECKSTTVCRMANLLFAGTSSKDLMDSNKRVGRELTPDWVFRRRERSDGSPLE